MRLGVAWENYANAYYRALYPMRAMAARGHEVVWPPEDGGLDLRRLARCDVVHVYRLWEPETQKALRALARNGTAFTYDNDDDFTATPKESPSYKRSSALHAQRAFALSVKIAAAARVFTTTSPVLAEKYRSAGVERTAVIGNYLPSGASRPRVPHDGFVIGWIAAHEHMADSARIDLTGALERVLEKHPDARVECIGVDLKLSQRYRHDMSLDFDELPERIGGFDLGIAPLADIPMNHARSDIKVKEYAASGVPWLASPIGPYASLGESEGGRLVPDDGWFEAIDRLLSRRREHRRLARKAEKWGRRQTVDAVAERWESVFAEAAASTSPVTQP